jgi:hypothetical protein
MTRYLKLMGRLYRSPRYLRESNRERTNMDCRVFNRALGRGK